MKSNLVDALRRAREEKVGKNLSDSGSFESTQQEFTAPANQDMADVEEAEELELMSTTRGLAVRDVTEAPAEIDAADENVEEMPVPFGDTTASATVLLTGNDCVTPNNSSLPSMPKLARHVPALCLAIAFIAGAGWQAYQRLEFWQDASALGGLAVLSRSVDEGQGPESADETDIRFRYLSGPLTTNDDEAAQ